MFDHTLITQQSYLACCNTRPVVTMLAGAGVIATPAPIAIPGPIVIAIV